MRTMTLALVAAVVAALIHIWFFVMESLWFMRPAVWLRFGITSEADASIVRSWAYNQGFYNLFLAIGVGVGLALVVSGSVESGRTLLLFACGSMVAAGVVLYLHNPRFLRAAAVQALPPLIAVAATLLAG